MKSFIKKALVNFIYIIDLILILIVGIVIPIGIIGLGILEIMHNAILAVILMTLGTIAWVYLGNAFLDLDKSNHRIEKVLKWLKL